MILAANAGLFVTIDDPQATRIAASHFTKAGHYHTLSGAQLARAADNISQHGRSIMAGASTRAACATIATLLSSAPRVGVLCETCFALTDEPVPATTFRLQQHHALGLCDACAAIILGDFA